MAAGTPRARSSSTTSWARSKAAPGFRATIVDAQLQTPTAMAERLHWPSAHPMHLDVTLDQLGPLRPIPALAGHRTPGAGLYVSGAGISPANHSHSAPNTASPATAAIDSGDIAAMRNAVAAARRDLESVRVD